MNKNYSNFQITDAYRNAFAEVLSKTFFEKTPSPNQEDLNDHIEGRYNIFTSTIAPWLDSRVKLKEKNILEVGSGTGASTLALAPHVGHIHCFELDNNAVDAAAWRLNYAGVNNVTLHAKAFDSHAAKAMGMVDGVFFAALLEHTSFDECMSILRTSWASLKSGGWLCVIDTPNRFCPLDYHTSMLPFFSMLPMEVRLAYAKNSPRATFASEFSGTKQRENFTSAERLIRWGAGISYHEFELALGSDVHQYIIADGYEPEIDCLLGTLSDDLIIQMQLKLFAPHVHRAFSRRAFHLIIRKP
jgi:2-polyprenyl-3-methyl-5-hydroxy-6-metoxy-1,4-benzoquinol methylase